MSNLSVLCKSHFLNMKWSENGQEPQPIWLWPHELKVKIQCDYPIDIFSSCKYEAERDKVSGLYLNFEEKVLPEYQSVGAVLHRKCDGPETDSQILTKALN